jgi:hypothetical protein
MSEAPKLTYQDSHITLRGHKPLLFDLGRLLPAVLRLLDPSNRRYDLQTRAMLQEASAYLVNRKSSDLDIWIDDSKMDVFLYMLPFLSLGSPQQITYNRAIEPQASSSGFIEDLYALIHANPYCFRDPALPWVPRESATVIGFFPGSDGPSLRKFLAALPNLQCAKLFIRNGARTESQVSIEVFREHQVWFSTRAEGYIVVEK